MYTSHKQKTQERRKNLIIISGSYQLPAISDEGVGGGLYALVEAIGVPSSICRVMAYLPAGRL